MALDEPQDNDTKIDINSIEFLFDKNLEPYVEDTVIDYQGSIWGTEFTVRRSYGVC